MICEDLIDGRYCGHPGIGKESGGKRHLCSYVRLQSDSGCPRGHTKSNSTSSGQSKSKWKQRESKIAGHVAYKNKKNKLKVMGHQQKSIARVQRRAKREALEKANATSKGSLSPGSDSQDSTRSKAIIKTDTDGYNANSKQKTKKFKEEHKGKQGFR